MCSFDYKGMKKEFIQTYFIIELFKRYFKEFELEWKQNVKKAFNGIKNQLHIFTDEIKQYVNDFIESLSLFRDN